MRLQSVLALMALLIAPFCAKGADTSCAERYASVDDRIFLAGPEAPRNQQYLQNSRIAYAEFLAGLDSDKPYEELLKTSHKRVVAGKDGKNTFDHPGSDSHPFNTGNLEAGVFRKSSRSYGFDISTPRVRDEIRRIYDNAAATNRPFIDGSITFSIRIPHSLKISPRDIRVAKDPKTNSISPKVLLVRYPPADLVPQYIEAMSAEFAEMRKILVGGASDPRHQEALLLHLADFIQLGAVAHAFDRVNMSVIMMQANAILARAGMHPLYHGALDALANGLDQENFRQAFVEYARAPDHWIR